MQEISFALPTLATTGMSVSDQRDCLLNQATAVLVCALLEHRNAILNKIPPSSAATTNIQIVSADEFVDIINKVQAALKSI